jgi:tyrosine-protein phosphatase YwqE
VQWHLEHYVFIALLCHNTPIHNTMPPSFITSLHLTLQYAFIIFHLAIIMLHFNFAMFYCDISMNHFGNIILHCDNNSTLTPQLSIIYHIFLCDMNIINCASQCSIVSSHVGYNTKLMADELRTSTALGVQMT